MKSKSLLTVALVSCGLLLTACGGSGGGDDPPPGGGPNTLPGGGTSYPSSGTGASSYLFYAGSINAVDPANPTAPITVEAGSDIVTDSFGAISAAAATIQAGTYDGATKTVAGMHSHALVYAKTDGHFYKVSAQTGVSLVPAQISSETQMAKLCLYSYRVNNMLASLAVFPDFAHPENSQIVYALPGASGDCLTSQIAGDFAWKMVRLGMNAADAPAAARQPVAVVRDVATGAISGWLVNDSTELKRCDANFANCGASLGSVLSNSPRVMLGLGLNRYVVAGLTTVVYDGDANTVTSVATSGDTLAADASSIYFVRDNSNDKSVYRVPADGSAAASALVTETIHPASDPQQIAVTNDKVIYILPGGVGQGAQVKAVNKTGGGAITLASTTVANSNASLYVSGNKIYYSFFLGALGPYGAEPIAAGVVDDNGGNKNELVDAMWIGPVLAASVSAGKSDDSTIPFPFARAPEKLIRVEGYDALGTGRGFAGGTLRSFNAATGAELALLGTLPATGNATEIMCWGSGTADNALCGVQSDIFFLNAATADSLKRVTAAGKSGFPIF